MICPQLSAELPACIGFPQIICSKADLYDIGKANQTGMTVSKPMPPL